MPTRADGNGDGVPPDERISVVVATRNRRSELLATVDRLTALPERPAVIVVDNGSTDGSAAALRDRQPQVRTIALDHNLGAAGRNVGVAAATTPFVAFADDDSWWAPGALRRAADVLEAHPRLGLVAADILVGPEERRDPTCHLMATSPLGTGAGLPGPSILGFLACAAVVRRAAFVEVGGFEELLGIGGEESLLAADLAAARWELCYLPDIVAHHHPSLNRDPQTRARRLLRNRLVVALMRRSPGTVGAELVAVLRRCLTEPAARGALLDGMGAIGPALRRRRALPPDVERQLRLIEA